MPIKDVQFTDDRWLQFWENFKGQEHQIKSIIKLGQQIKQADPGLLTETAEWAEGFKAGPVPKPQPRFMPRSSFSFKITPNVTYGELTLQSEARRFQHQHQCDTAVLLAQFVQRARDFYNRPAIITSGYRPPKINAQVGGASRSEHLYDKPDTGAIDFYLDGIPVIQLQRWADKEWPYSLGYGAPRGFIHLGVRPGRPRVRWDY
jgi:hypothetical protein